VTDTPGEAAPRTTKQEKALDLGRDRYQLRRAAKGPYLLLGEQKYSFGGRDKKALRADLKYAWRRKYPNETPPPDSALGSVIEDLRRLALDAEPDPVTEEDADKWLDDHGVGEIPPDRGIGLVLDADECPLADGYRIPDDYLVTTDGIWYLTGRWGPSRAAWAWLFPVRVYLDPAGDQWLELTWRDSGRWVSRLVRRSVAKSGRKLIAEVGDAGLPVTDSEARDAEKWIAAAESANHAVIGRHPVARQLGWQADGKTFVTGQDAPWRVEPRYADQAAALAAHRASGTLGGWQQSMKHAEPHIVVQVGVYAGLAGPLLVPLALDSFTIDFSGKSTRGKTITLMAALSCWADPSEKGDALFSWQTTVMAAEKRLNLVNGLVVGVDETRLVKDRETVDTLLYSIPKNHGKPRGGNYPNSIPWRAVVVSTGEQPATSFTTHQGASARVLSIRRPPFGTDGDASAAAANLVRTGIEENHGTAGPGFVARLQMQLAEDGGLARLRERHEVMTQKLLGSSDMSARRAPSIAALALAATLAADWGIVPFTAPEPRTWLELLAPADDPRDNRPEMALDVVREYVASHSDKLWGQVKDGNDERPPASGWIGRYSKHGLALVPEKLSEELKRREYDLDAALPGWLEMGALVINENRRPPYKIPQRIAGHSVPCLIFKPEVLDSGDTEEDA
jgi:hypothetical protein